ncbi:MAG: 50S ribosomal protein L25 [Candidatus Krumholzibacteria bacterium]
METQKLDSICRESFGKGHARKIRATGRIPAVIYGYEEEAIAISLSGQDLRRVLTAGWETTIVDLNIEGKINKQCSAIIKEVQQHPATGKVLHVDFQYIRRGQKIRLDVPVKLSGDPRGVKEMGGILEHGSRELAVRCMPRHIPDAIEIDVTGLGIHDAIHLKEIVERYPDIEFLDDVEATLAIVVPPKIEVEPTVTEEEEEEGPEEPEVIAKGKDEKEAEPTKEKDKEAGK